ncbi:uncharacterized protein LOC144749631 [Ciona intestinalis]
MSPQVIVKTHYVTVLRLLYPQANIDDVRKSLIATNNNLTDSKSYLQRLGYKEAKTPSKAATPNGQTKPKPDVKKLIVTSSKPTLISPKATVTSQKNAVMSPKSIVTSAKAIVTSPKKSVTSQKAIMTSSKPSASLYTRQSCANGPNPTLHRGPDPTLPQGPNKLNLSS